MTEAPVFYDPVAGNLFLEFECSESWEEMPRSGRKRNCSACHRDVYDLGDHTSNEVAELLERGACIRAEVEPDGQLVTLGMLDGSLLLSDRITLQRRDQTGE